MSHFMKIGEASLVMIVTVDKSVPFRVDEELVPWLKKYNWHIADSRRPEALAPVIRKRDPRTGMGKTLRLPVVAKVFSTLDEKMRDTCAANFPILVDLCKSTRVPSKPFNGVALDCRLDNWTRELVPLTDRDCLVLKDEDDPLLMQGPEVLSPPTGLPSEDLVEILTGQATPSHKGLTSLSHATLSVEQILAIARGDFPQVSPPHNAA